MGEIKENKEEIEMTEDNPFDNMEIAVVRAFSKWQTMWAWIFKFMTGMKIGLLYKEERDGK